MAHHLCRLLKATWLIHKTKPPMMQGPTQDGTTKEEKHKRPTKLGINRVEVCAIFFLLLFILLLLKRYTTLLWLNLTLFWSKHQLKYWSVLRITSHSIWISSLYDHFLKVRRSKWIIWKYMTKLDILKTRSIWTKVKSIEIKKHRQSK